VRTRKGFRKACIRGYIRSAPLAINVNNGTELDRSADIAETFYKDKDGLNTYFTDKESSIRRQYREDSNSAAIEGVPASELHDWQLSRDDLLEQLKDQKDDVFDLASVSDESSDDETASVNNSTSNYINASSPGSDVTGTSNVNDVESTSNDSSHQPQDTSEVVQTDFSSFEPFDD